MDQKDLDSRFAQHVVDEKNAKAMDLMRRRCGKLGALINKTVPPGREKSLAITHLEEVMFWANAGIARKWHLKDDSSQD